MSNELTSYLNQLPSTQIGTDAGFDKLAQGGDFLGRLQLYTKGKNIDKGLIPPGHYGVPDGESIEDLGDSVDLMPFARRPKAMDMSDKQAIVVSYDQESELFQRIAAQAQEKESNCMYGPSFLVYERSTGRFLEFYCGTKSTRTEAKKLYPFLPLSAADIAARKVVGQEPRGALPATLKVRLVERQFSWHVPVVTKCSVPFSDLPPGDEIVKEIQKFLTPKTDGVEPAEPTRNRRAR